MRITERDRPIRNIEKPVSEITLQRRAYGEYANAGVDEHMVRCHQCGTFIAVVEPLSACDGAEHEQGLILCRPFGLR